MLDGYLPEEILVNISKINNIQEIRLRLGKPYMVINSVQEYVFDVLHREKFGQVVKMLTSHSVYAIRENLKNGFITIKGGHRVGFTGNCVIKNGEIYHIKDINGINIRIAREFVGISENICNIFLKEIDNLLIISPPGFGKTTYLRDIGRYFSYKGINVSVVDERYEIFPQNENGNCFDSGPRCDVISGCSKEDGIMLTLRVMNPSLIICDELASIKDVKAVVTASKSGVKIIATMHGFDENDYLNRQEFNDLKELNIFKKILVLKKEGTRIQEKMVEI